MNTIPFYPLDEIDDALIKFAVIPSTYQNKWIFCQHKNRSTWETPGGTREAHEAIITTATRELFEETGAIDFNLEPICLYLYQGTYGILCYASVQKLGKLPDSEISNIKLFTDFPDNFTYPTVIPQLLAKVNEYLASKINK